MNRRSFFIAGMTATVSATLRATPRLDVPIVLGNVSLSFYAVTGAVVATVLERLGHRVEIKRGLHEEIFPLLGQGKIDLMAAAWLPEGHAAYWAQYGAHAVEVATLYQGARFFWAVPSYVPREDLGSIADLAKPDVVQRMTREIQGIGQGATISVMSQRAIAQYGLAALGYAFRPGTPAQWIEAYTAATARTQWIVFPTWTPQYLNRDQGLRPLEDPRGVLGGLNRASLVGPRERVEALPKQTRQVLSRIELDLAAVTQMDWDVNVRKLTPVEAAQAWMAAHDVRVSRWFGDTSR